MPWCTPGRRFCYSIFRVTRVQHCTYLTRNHDGNDELWLLFGYVYVRCPGCEVRIEAEAANVLPRAVVARTHVRQAPQGKARASVHHVSVTCPMENVRYKLVKLFMSCAKQFLVSGSSRVWPSGGHIRYSNCCFFIKPHGRIGLFI